MTAEDQRPETRDPEGPAGRRRENNPPGGALLLAERGVDLLVFGRAHMRKGNQQQRERGLKKYAMHLTSLPENSLRCLVSTLLRLS